LWVLFYTSVYQERKGTNKKQWLLMLLLLLFFFAFVFKTVCLEQLEIEINIIILNIFLTRNRWLIRCSDIAQVLPWKNK